MKKIVIYAALLLLVVGIAIIFIINQPNSTPNKSFNQTKSKPRETEHTNETNNVSKEKKDTKTEDDDTEKRQISDVLSDAVQGTVDYFSNKETHVTAVGDSLTQGVGDSQGKGGYVGILDRTVNEKKQLVKFDNYGVRGNRTDQLLKRLDNEEVSSAIADSDIVLITIGANDIMKVVKENITDLSFKDFVKERVGYEQRLRDIFDKIRDLNPNTEIYLIGFYNPFGQYFKDIDELDTIVKEWNHTGTSVAADYEGITFIPIDDLFSDPDTDEDLFAGDNFHPNDLGYKRMAKRVLSYLTNNEG
jgi:lysophospholipase L1-like esterase